MRIVKICTKPHRHVCCPNKNKGKSHCRPGRFPGRRDIYAHVCFQTLRLLTVNILEFSENQRRVFSGACIGFLCSRQEFCREGPYSQSTVECQATAEPSSLEILGHPTCHSWPESHFPHCSCILIFTFQNGRRVLGEEIPTEDAAHITGNIWPKCVEFGIIWAEHQVMMSTHVTIPPSELPVALQQLFELL